MAPAYQVNPVTVMAQEAELMAQEAGVLVRIDQDTNSEILSEPVQSAKVKMTDERTLAVHLPSHLHIVDRAIDAWPASTKWLRLNNAAATTDEPASGATKLRRLLFESNELIVCPGVYDGLSARTALELGFSGLYMVRQSLFIYLWITWLTDTDWSRYYRIAFRTARLGHRPAPRDARKR